MSDEPSSTFDQWQQHVDRQTNLAGDLMQRITVVQGSGAGTHAVQVDRRAAENVWTTENAWTTKNTKQRNEREGVGGRFAPSCAFAFFMVQPPALHSRSPAKE